MALNMQTLVPLTTDYLVNHEPSRNAHQEQLDLLLDVCVEKTFVHGADDIKVGNAIQAATAQVAAALKRCSAKMKPSKEFSPLF
jgi:hypothetical protein